MAKNIIRIVTAVAAVTVFVLIGVLGYNSSQQSATNSRLQQEVGAYKAKVGDLSSQVSDLSSQVGDLSSQVGSLNAPTDPLSAYNFICNMPLTNADGGTTTYYFPCTNNVQTIPQPGN